MRLPRLASTAVLLVLLTATLAAGASNETTATPTTDITAANHPAAVVPKSHHEFESVVDGTEITHDFAIRNTGEGPLVIQQVKTG